MNELLIPEHNGLYPVKSADLSTRIDHAVACIAEVAPIVFQAWNRSHSDMIWNAMNLDHETDTRNLREIGATLQRRRDALTEVHFAHQECLINAKIHDEQAEDFDIEGKGTLAAKERLLAQKERAYAQMKHEAIMGATKDISSLKSSYDKVMARIIEKHGHFDEEIFEVDEKEYWIKRLMIQAMRDVRECGSIRAGAQRDLEQLGIEPLEALKDIESYFVNVQSTLAKGETITREMRDKWSDALVLKYTQRLTDKVNRMGQDTNHLFKLERKNDS
jgi:hypothetical protein